MAERTGAAAGSADPTATSVRAPAAEEPAATPCASVAERPTAASLPAPARVAPSSHSSSTAKPFAAAAASASRQAVEQWKEGDACEAKHLAQDNPFKLTKWYPGTVHRVLPDGRLDITYDDDDFEEHVPPKFVRARKSNSVPAAAAVPAVRAAAAGASSRGAIATSSDGTAVATSSAAPARAAPSPLPPPPLPPCPPPGESAPVCCAVGHPLLCQLADGGTLQCDGCPRSIDKGASVWSCAACDFDLCAHCAAGSRGSPGSATRRQTLSMAPKLRSPLAAS